VARISAQAAGYKAERVARASGDAERFDLLFKEYRMAPKVTRERLWLETVEGVLARNPKVYDGSKGRNVFYLPMDHLGSGGKAAATRLPGVGPVLKPANDSSSSASSSQGGRQ
jgi:membrane protease subunit HflK